MVPFPNRTLILFTMTGHADEQLVIGGFVKMLSVGGCRLETVFRGG